MSDLIDRQATIDTLDKHLRTTDVPVSYPGIISALTEWLNELPSAQADSKELSGTHKALDTVSRQAVIEAINKIFPADPMHDDYTQGITCGAALANIYVAQLPPAQPETHEERTETHACDLISRQAAIDAILAVTGNSSVRELYEHVQEHGLSDMWSGGVNAAIDIIIAVPSAQPDLSGYSDKLWQKAYERGRAEAQAEIVRCKDCKHSRFFDPCFYCYEFGEEINVPENGFCFMAERRTDERPDKT